jgi:hypothetical protein
MVIGCSSSNKSKVAKKFPPIKGESFNYSDKNGKYIVNISSGVNSKENTFILKKSIGVPGESNQKTLEQSVTISEIGSIKKTNILRPKLSQYTVWFDGKKYFSELKINPKKKAVEVKLESSEKNWNGTKLIKFPTTKLISCFFSQLVECVNVTGYFEQITKKQKAKMNFLIIWEGYPYLNETYSDIPSELFSKATIEFDGKLKDNEFRYSVNVAGQSIFYVIDKDKKFRKMFWVSQGITMVPKSDQESTSNSESDIIE